jgi:acyl-CoA synthetase (NDP forming)
LNTAPGATMNGTFSHGQPAAGNVAIATQSGALGFVFPEYMHQWQLGISQLVSLGNKLDIGENDLLQHWEGDEHTKVIQLYLESFQSPREFLEVARRISRTTPIVALKSGRTEAGTRAAASHTAALAGPRVAATGSLRQAGVIQAGNLEELFATTAVLSMQPPPRGSRIAILTNAGGPGVLCADTLESQGLTVPELSLALQNQLRQRLPLEATVSNPVDLIGGTDPEEFRRCQDVLLQSDETDAVIAIYVPRLADSSAAIADAMLASATEHAAGKTVLAVIMESGPPPASLSAGPVRIPCYRYPETAAQALARAFQWAEWRRAPASTIPAARVHREARHVVEEALTRGEGEGGWMAVDDVQRLLTSFELPVPTWRIADSADAAAAAAGQIGFPVVLKAIASGLVHKTEAGGVILDLHGPDDVRDAWRKMRDRVSGLTAVMVQQLIPATHEIMIGVTHHEQFGHLISFGLGGVMVTAWGDIQVRLAPLAERDAEELIRESKAGRLLTHSRGGSAADVAAVRDALLRVSEMVRTVSEIREADFNPLAVHAAGEGIDVLDARIRLAGQREE